MENFEFHITEFHVWLENENAGKLQEQVDTFTSILKTVLDNRKDGLVGINLWQIRGNETFNEDWDGCLFNEDYSPKPAYSEIKELLMKY